MNAREAAWQPAEEAASALEPEAGLVGQLDMAGFGRSLVTVLARSAWHPAAVAGAVLRFAADLAMTWSAAATLRVWAASTTPAGQDKRFTDPAWDDNPAYFAIRQSYLAARRLSEELLQAGRGEPVSDAKAHFAAGLLLDAVAPTNFLPTNPVAVKRAFETAGRVSSAGHSISLTT